MMRFETPAFRIIRLKETDSTNNYLKELCVRERVEEFTVVAADFQTAGRGQRGNGWESERGKNLLFSMVLYPEFVEVRKHFVLSQMVALAIKEELDTLSEGFSVKWPNDIYWREKKISGTLIENDITGPVINRCIAGIGVNVNQEKFHGPALNPVSLRQIGGEAYDLVPLLEGIAGRIFHYYHSCLKPGGGEEIGKRYRDALFRKGGMHRYRDKQGEFMARIVRIAPDGALVLEDEYGNEREYAFKEVEYIL